MNVGTILVVLLLVAGVGAWLSLVASLVYSIMMVRRHPDDP